MQQTHLNAFFKTNFMLHLWLSGAVVNLTCNIQRLRKYWPILGGISADIFVLIVAIEYTHDVRDFNVYLPFFMITT